MAFTLLESSIQNKFLDVSMMMMMMMIALESHLCVSASYKQPHLYLSHSYETGNYYKVISQVQKLRL